MNMEYILALFWGFLWAGFLQFHKWGRWLAESRTWLTVVVGVGVDLIIALFVVPIDIWNQIALLIVLSSIGIIYRSLSNEMHDKTTPAKKRLPNKTLWNLDDIREGVYPQLQVSLRTAKRRAELNRDWELLAAVAEISRDVEIVYRRVLDARRGEYNE